jgi:hypothetical protein
MNVLAGHAFDAEVDDTVGEEQRVADADLGGEPRVRDGHAIPEALDWACREGEPTPGLELDAAVCHCANADLRAREILEDRRGHVELFAERTDLGEDGPVLRRLTVREVEPGHVHPALEEGPELRRGRGGRADRADDLRSPLDAGDVGHASPARR